MRKKLQIFVSSTFEDLKKERQMVMEAILEVGHLPAGMEYFVSDDAHQFDIIKKWIQESDAYLLIVGGRYGSINPADPQKRSYTHLELEYARKLKKPIRILLLSKTFLDEKIKKGDYKKRDFTNKRLIAFKKNLPTCNPVNSIGDIKSVTKTMLKSLNGIEQKDTYGWIRASDVAPLIKLHPNNIQLARSKSITGTYNVYYYSFGHNRHVYSKLSFKTKNGILVSTFENDIDSRGNSMYSYTGKFEIFDDFLYVELKSNTDNEKLHLIIKLLPGKLTLSAGIIVGQGTDKQAVATTFIISNAKITSLPVLDEFRLEQFSQFTKTEKLSIDDDTIKFLVENLSKHQKTFADFGGI